MKTRVYLVGQWKQFCKKKCQHKTVESSFCLYLYRHALTQAIVHTRIHSRITQYTLTQHSTLRQHAVPAAGSTHSRSTQCILTQHAVHAAHTKQGVHTHAALTFQRRSCP